jgi:hypothetical protein
MSVLQAAQVQTTGGPGTPGVPDDDACCGLLRSCIRFDGIINGIMENGSDEIMWVS